MLYVWRFPWIGKNEAFYFKFTLSDGTYRIKLNKVSGYGNLTTHNIVLKWLVYCHFPLAIKHVEGYKCIFWYNYLSTSKKFWLNVWVNDADKKFKIKIQFRQLWSTAKYERLGVIKYVSTPYTIINYVTLTTSNSRGSAFSSE